MHSVSFHSTHQKATQRGVNTQQYLLSIKIDHSINDVLKQAQGMYNQPLPDASVSRQQSLIAIAGFRAPERMEDTLSRWAQRICMQHGVFVLTLNNFSGVPPHTVYLRIQDTLPIWQFIAQLRKLDPYLTGYDLLPIETINKPYLPVLEKLPAAQYDHAMRWYAGCELHAQVLATNLVLQKRAGNGWQHLRVFPFATAAIVV